MPVPQVVTGGMRLTLPRQVWAQAALGCGLLAFTVLCYRTAWVSDDAFISLRTVSNLLQGYGMRWNVDERVQTFTHPLWLLLLTAAHATTGEPFYSTLYLSCLVSTLAVAGLLFVCPGALVDKLVALAVLLFSQSFVDFSTSGLENPLTHLLVVTFVAVYVREGLAPRARAFWLSLIAGCAAFNRMDSAGLFVPALGYVMWTTRREVPLRYYLIGALPLLAWEAFSIIYYGFPFPNTAYAKLSQDRGETLIRWLKGWNYLRSSFSNDPITLSALLGSVSLCVWRRDYTRFWLLCGAPLYVAYAVSVGGDFMTGRFLSAPLCLAMACLITGQWLRSAPLRVVAALLVSVLAVSGRFAAPFLGADYTQPPGEREVDEFLIHNERRMFFQVSSLINAHRMNPLRPDHPWADSGWELRKLVQDNPAARIQIVDAIGYAGYFAGPQVHLVDHWALADALIARLPATGGQYGHFPRIIPHGYQESLRTHTNRILDPDLAQYYKELSTVIRGPIWSWERMRAIWRFNTGQLQSRLDSYAYVRSQKLQVNVLFRNPGKRPVVVAYVWNEGRTAGYTLDVGSTEGKLYDITWQIDARGARLITPTGAVQSTTLDGLEPSGLFSVAVALIDREGGPLREIHELRYHYRLRGDRIEVQRQPEATWNGDFPDARWQDGRVALGLESTTAVP
jgi:arabinofuranosyltransferase